jgi:hypothetical protein
MAKSSMSSGKPEGTIPVGIDADADDGGIVRFFRGDIWLFCDLTIWLDCA